MEEIFDNDKTQELLKKIDNDLKKELSEKRYKHSIGVMKKAEELAKIYKVDINKAKLVGLAHDIGKELSREEKIQYARENQIDIDDIELINVGLLHGKIGADICKKRYGFTYEMQEAIKYHTIGNENMTLFDKIIFIADKIEENRHYKINERQERLEQIRKIVHEDLDKALLAEIDMSLEYTIKKEELIHPDMIFTRNRLITKMQ